MQPSAIVRATFILSLLLLGLPVAAADSTSPIIVADQLHEAHVLAAKGDLRGAIAIYQQMAKSRPYDENAVAAYLLACETLVSGDPRNPDVHITLGQACQDTGYFRRAHGEYNEAIRYSQNRINELASRRIDQLTALQAAIWEKQGQAVPKVCQFEKTVKERWRPPKHDQFLSTLVDLSLDQEGKIIGEKVMVPSTSPAQDQSALDVINETSFGALPDGLDRLDIHFALSSDSLVKYAQVSLNPRDSSDTSPPRRTVTGAPTHWISIFPSARILTDFGSADLGQFLFSLDRSITKAWNPTKPYEDKLVIVLFRIHSDGSMSDLRLGRSCGIAAADRAALLAVQTAIPAGHLPLGAPEYLDIEFDFQRALRPNLTF